ncbi:polysaccharide pyruvyl transferase family protein [Streptomyces sp. NBC_01381]|uniref:polysaccharide pyruvyl transferase family protein n=1 Tax=Streptomyces sp. NBC_01381 TaxID=2903845 RepID=UPI00224E826E|nr:polysaccharide pyruvyl transferase family protein [Streptomyces sp. NBC_01381]MCX4666486.1 polysaccharide pyruvyl transferase family protein [Streptomyces sp. NBC_01381]
MVRNVIITGVTSCENRGVEALVASIAAGLHDHGEARIRVLTQTPMLDQELLTPWGVECVADPFVTSKSWTQYRPAETSEQSRTRRDALMEEADLLVATGGDIYTSDYGVSTPYLAAPIAAQSHGVPVAMLAHSIGPFTHREDAQAWLDVAEQCKVLTLRERLSYRYVQEELGLTAGKAQLTADPAFLLPAPPQQRVQALVTTAGIGPGEPYICVAPSRGIARFRSLDEVAHDRALGRLIDRLVTRWKIPVLLLPHVHDSRSHNDDRALVAELAQHIGHPLVKAVTGPLTASDYKGLAAAADLVITERLHAAIGALSTRTPTVAIGYSQKFLGVFADTYGNDIDLDSVHLDVDRFVADEHSTERLLQGLQLPSMQQALTERVPELLERARENFTLLAATSEVPA